MPKFRSASSSTVKAELLREGIPIRSGSSSATATATGDIKSEVDLHSLYLATNLAQKLSYDIVTQQTIRDETDKILYTTVDSTTTTERTVIKKWITNSSTLQASDGENTYKVKLTGFSLTRTENYAGYYIYNDYYLPSTQINTACLVYFNYYNYYVYSNLVNVANIIYGSTSPTYNSGSLSSSSINNIPSVRIPINADYWFNGAGVGSQIYLNTLSFDPSANMTAAQYQNMIIGMVCYLMNPSSNDVTTFSGTANGCVIILDLHWNYSNNNDSANQASGSYTTSTVNGVSSTPPGQCAMAVASNSVAFWNSISSVFGVDANGNELNPTTCTINLGPNTVDPSGNLYPANNIQCTLTSDMKKNIFFELYNEPYLDQIQTTTNGSSYQSYSDYANNFKLYIQGSQSATGYPIKDPSKTSLIYNTVGMGTLYNNIRITNKCSNVIILGGAESYAYFAGQNYIAYGSPNNFISDSNVDKNGNSLCYNCWTKLNDAIIGGSIPIMNPDGTLTGDAYDNNPNGLVSVLANIHPYSNGYAKFPGYMYNTSNSSTSTYPNNGNQSPCLSNFLQALQNGTNPSYTVVNPTAPYNSGTELCSGFQISFPIISTEFGMYNLPWINSTGGITYTASYNADQTHAVSQGSATYWAGLENTIGSYNYWGQYYDENGNPTNSPFIIGYFENFNTFNISYTIWVLLPNVNAFNQNTTTQVNYSVANQNTATMTLLQDSNINLTTPGQNAFDMNFCFQKYYLNTTGAIDETNSIPPA